LELQLSLGPALMAARGYGAAEVEETYARAHELCRHLGTGPNRFAVLRGLWEYYQIRARTETALPAVGGSWRLDVVLWAVPALLIAPVFLLASPKIREDVDKQAAGGRRWWPDWKNPVVWLLGFTFAITTARISSPAPSSATIWRRLGMPELLGAALGWLNGSQLVAMAVLFLTANRLQMRAWPFLVFGPTMLAAFLAMIIFVTSPLAIVAATAVIGIAGAVSMTAILALPPCLCVSTDVPRTAAGMFTISYTCAIIIPTICGALWDLTSKPWTAFVPLCLCAVALAVLGTVVTRRSPAVQAARPS
jgi:MFS transporter, CP family, cyanate transporter